MAEPWLRCYRGPVMPRFSFVCLPHAGGNATAYAAWPRLLGDDIGVYAVRYPGRLDRAGERAATAFSDIVAPVARAVTALTGPIVLFGHSMGAALAHEVAVSLEDAGRAPLALVVSGREAPHLAEDIPQRSDEELLELCRSLGGLPREVLDDLELREIVLGPLRADSRLLRGHAFKPLRRVRTPIIACLGTEDRGCTVAQLDGWREVTYGPFRLRLFAGNHFYLVDQAAELIEGLGQDLRELDA